MAQNSVKPIPLSTMSSTTVTAVYQPINSAGFPAALFFLRIVNDSNEPITISYDGVNDHEYIPSDTQLDLDCQTNSQPNARFALFTALTVVYVKGTAGTGTIALSGYHV